MIIQSTRVWLEEELRPAMIKIVGSRIAEILPYDHEKADVDYGSRMILPGFIDIHDHGYHGGDANHATNAFIKEWAAYLPQEGITSFLPTTSTAFKEDLLSSYRVLGEAMEEPIEGAQMLGLHLEGPMISQEYRGSHNPKLILTPDAKRIREWNAISGHHIKMVTLAPENDMDLQTVSFCVQQGIVVSIGHSAATYAQAKAAVEHGASNFAHTFNGMRGFHHREAGTAGAAMDLEDAYAEIIADGVHVDFPVVRILGKLKGKDRLIAVTDSIWAKGMPAGVYPKPEKGIDMIIDEQNVVRLKSGSLAGSTNRLNIMVRNLVQKAGLPLSTAINSVTANPARLLKIDDHKGCLKTGYDADITVADDQFHIQATYVNGCKRFDHASDEAIIAVQTNR